MSIDGRAHGLTQHLPQRIRLSWSGSWAVLEHDDLTETGVVLSIDGAEQSHVEVGEPGYLLHDYTYRMASILQASGHVSGDGGKRSPSVLHLGAGALTLPRWIDHYEPNAEQFVVDIEPELVDFVLEHLPMPRPPHAVVADAAEVLGSDGALAQQTFQVAVIDLFNGAHAPASLTSTSFYSQVLAALEPEGLLLVNLGDEPGMQFAQQQVAQLLHAVRSAESSGSKPADSSAVTPAPGCPVRCLLTAPLSVLSGSYEGNLVFAVQRGRPFSDAALDQIWADGPHPGDVLYGESLETWTHR